jgi:hypothetical protein
MQSILATVPTKDGNTPSGKEMETKKQCDSAA